MKTCTQCAVEKPEVEFYKSVARCKQCVAIDRKAYYQKNRNKILEARKQHYENNRDTILDYKKQFHDENRSQKCEYNKAYREANRDALIEYTRRWQADNLADWRNSNREKINAQARDRRKTDEYRAISLGYAQKRRARKLQAATNWDPELDDLVVSEAAILAKLREKIVGGKWHIDHVIPLKNKIVCGLHNAYNLAVIPAIENMRKGNRLKLAAGSGI